MLLTDMVIFLQGDELRKTDRLSMWHSLEVRVPFLDHKVVEFSATISAKYKLKGWEKKHILIKPMEELTPRSILSRRKEGFSIPRGAWMRGPLRELVKRNLHGSVLPAGMPRRSDTRALESSALHLLRRQAVRGGMSQNDATRTFGASLRAVSTWRRFDREGGLRALTFKRR